jgi:hypothetical protein
MSVPSDYFRSGIPDVRDNFERNSFADFNNPGLNIDRIFHLMRRNIEKAAVGVVKYGGTSTQVAVFGAYEMRFTKDKIELYNLNTRGCMTTLSFAEMQSSYPELYELFQDYNWVD